MGESANGIFNITPITDTLSKYAEKDGLDEALASLATSLDLTELDIYGDPVADTTLEDPLYRILSSGTQTGTLDAGDYTLFVVEFSLADLGVDYSDGVTKIKTDNVVEMDITVDADGIISGEAPFITNSVVTGKVQGSTLILNIMNNSNPTMTDFLIRVCGTIGFLNSVAGNYVELQNLQAIDGPQATDLDKGVFLATFLSDDVTPAQLDGLVQQAQKLWPTGADSMRRFAFRDVFGDDNDMGWGDITLNTFDPSDVASIATDDVPVTIGSADVTKTKMTLYNLTMENTAGEFLQTSGELPGQMSVLEYDLKFGGATIGKVYLVVPIGIRRGIYISLDNSGEVDGVGEVYMTRSDAILPALATGTLFQNTIAAVGVHLLGETRGSATVEFAETFNTPNNIDGSPSAIIGTDTANELRIFTGSMIGIKLDLNDNGLGDTDDDRMMLVEVFESGAFQGERVQGGCLSVLGAAVDCVGGEPPVRKLKTWPATFVGFALEDGETAPSFTGTLNLIARTLYTSDYDEYINAYITGTLAITGTGAGMAVLNAEDAEDNPIGATLSVENNGGLLHIYGEFGTDYLDIYLPVGGNKATYAISDAANGGGIYTEVGEAYMTR